MSSMFPHLESSDDLNRILLFAFTSLTFVVLTLAQRKFQYESLRKELPSRARLEEKDLKSQFKGKPIRRSNMLDGSCDDLKHGELYAISFARKPGFEELIEKSFGTKTPLAHAAIGISSNDEDFLIIGRQSPYYRESKDMAQRTPAKQRAFYKTEPDNEKNYLMFNEKADDMKSTSFYMEGGSVQFTAVEIVHVISRGKYEVCEEHCTMFGSNCYSFSVYALTQFMDMLDKRSPEKYGDQNQNIIKMARLLISACDDHYAEGVCNNSTVMTAIRKAMDICKRRGLTSEILPAQPGRAPPL